MLHYFRKLGSMEQLFPVFNDLKINGWGPVASAYKIPGLSQIPLNKIQKLWNKIHSKYESLQTQILTIDNISQYDDFYIGCLPFQVIKCDSSKNNIHQIIKREANIRYSLLNDYNLTSKHIKTGDYNIQNIKPLYRILICDDYFVLNYLHSIGDGLSVGLWLNNFLGLVNNDNTFTDEIVPFNTIEQCIEPKYSSSAVIRKITDLIPMSAALYFTKFYVNNSFLYKYNPLNIHRDELLRSYFMFNSEMLQFPLKKFNKLDYNLDYKYFTLSKETTLNVIKQCKLRKVHVSSLFQYVGNAAMIECHNDILNKDYYKTLIGNAFSTRPMYKDQNKSYVGMHSCSYNTVVEYYKNVAIGSDKWWKLISDISKQVLSDDMVTKLYQNKFPWLNIKKFMKYALTDKYNIIGNRSFGPPTISNPGMMKLNKKQWKYKITENFGAVNPAVGLGAPYILGGLTVKGVGIMTITFGYGTQSITEDMASKVVNKIKEMLQIVGSLHTNFKSKL